MAYVGLYAVKGLWITGALYLLFIALCVGGYRAWKRHEVVAAAAGPQPAVPLLEEGSQRTTPLVEEGAQRPSRDRPTRIDQ